MYRDSIQTAISNATRTLKVPPEYTLSEWAEEHFFLSAESSYIEQRWTAYPFQKAILDLISNDDVEELDLRKSARVGYTKIILAAMCYFAQHKHRNQAVWQPTDEDSDEFVKTELEPVLRDVSVMADVFPEYLKRHKNNTLRQKTFLGSMLHMRGGKAAKNYRRLSLSTAFIDESDGFDNDIEGEGSPVALAKKRLEGATFPKLVIGSTPKLKGWSLVEGREAQSSIFLQFRVPCPHCRYMQKLEWGGRDKSYGFKWTGDDPDTAAYLCRSCGGLFKQPDYLSVWDEGRWESSSGVFVDPKGLFRDAEAQQITTPRHVSMHIWTAYSPQAAWPAIVREFLDAKHKSDAGDTAELKTFTNTTLGESWEEKQSKTDQHVLKRRAENYALRTVPAGGLRLGAGVDVQDDRFEIVTWAYGRGEEMWPVDYAVLHANPANESEWENILWPYLDTRFPHELGAKIPIHGTSVDTGGHFTHQAYVFCRNHAHRRVFAVKGEERPGQPVKGRNSLQDINWRGRVIRNGVKLWHVGTDTAKDLLYGRLGVSQPGPGFVHFSTELPDAFYDQITAEARVLQKSGRGEVYRWVKIRKRNEVLDCTVYSMFVAHMLDLHRYTEKMWKRIEERYRISGEAEQALTKPDDARPALTDAEAPMQTVKPPAPPAPVKRVPTRRPRGGFASNW